MLYLFQLALLISIIAIAIEDFKCREIHVYWIVSAFLFALLPIIFLDDLSRFFKGLTCNLIYIVSCFLLLAIVARRKGKKVFELTAIGDWLMFLVFSVLFHQSTFGFILFLLGGFSIGILGALARSRFRPVTRLEIPLAGYLCILFVVVQASSYLCFANSTLVL